jgi:hypothetical protein
VGDIKMGLRNIGWGGIDWIELAQDRDRWRALVNTVMTFLNSCATGDFSGRAQLHEVS